MLLLFFDRADANQHHFETRNFGLDAIRVIAISLVLLCHMGLFFAAQHNAFTFGALPVFGFLGVELFFGLSGFLIGSILLEGKEKLAIFYLKRMMKIVPPYFLLVVIIFLTSGARDVLGLMAHLAFVQNFFAGMAAIFPVSWSLSIEVWFYVFVPLLLLNTVAKKNIGRQVLMLCIGVAIAFLLIRTAYVYVFHPDWEFGVHRFIPLRFDTLIFGVMAAVIARQHGRLHDFLTRRWVVVGNLVLCGGLCAAFGALYFFNTYDSARLLQSVGLSALSFSIMGIILAAKKYIAYPRHLKKWGKAVTFVSLISYSLYLLHLFVYMFVAQMPGNRTMLYITAVGLSIVAAWIIYEVVEKNALRARNLLQRTLFARQATNQAIESEVVRQP